MIDKRIARQRRVSEQSAMWFVEVGERTEPTGHVGHRRAIAQERQQSERHAQRSEEVGLERRGHTAASARRAKHARVIDERTTLDDTIAQLLCCALD